MKYKYNELPEESKKSVIDFLSNYIDNKASEQEVKYKEEPSREEYDQFFTDLDEDYDISGDYPETNLDISDGNLFGVEFIDGKVILYVSPCEEEDF